MSSRRALKAAQAIREVVSTAILLELKDPRVEDVTVTMVEVAGDLRAAKVYVSVMGDETKQNLCLNGLRSSTGFLQKRVGNRIDTRYTPRLTFVLDKGAQNAMEVTRILKEVLPEPEPENQDEDGLATDDAETSTPRENVWTSIAKRSANAAEESGESSASVSSDSPERIPTVNETENDALDHSATDLTE